MSQNTDSKEYSLSPQITKEFSAALFEKLIDKTDSIIDEELLKELEKFKLEFTATKEESDSDKNIVYPTDTPENIQDKINAFNKALRL